MKEILKVAFVYAGCFLGAGYVSGQELYQFFGSFGTYGYSGLFVSFLLQLILGFAVVAVAKNTGIYEADKIIVIKENKALRGFFGFFESLFMFGIFVIMSAGAGTLVNQLTKINETVAVLIFCVLCTIFALSGVKGMTKVFSFVVPLLVVFTTAISLICMKNGDFSFVSDGVQPENPLLKNWLVSAVVFVSYNFFCSIAILAPVGVKVKSTRKGFWGILLGCVLLLAISFGIVASMSVFKESCAEELPMLFISSALNRELGTVYGILLLLAMFSASLSCIVATVVYLKTKLPDIKEIPVTLIICAGGFLLGRVGFSQLISFIYPVCGYLGFFAAFGVLYSFMKGRKKDA